LIYIITEHDYHEEKDIVIAAFGSKEALANYLIGKYKINLTITEMELQY